MINGEKKIDKLHTYNYMLKLHAHMFILVCLYGRKVVEAKIDFLPSIVIISHTPVNIGKD